MIRLNLIAGIFLCGQNAVAVGKEGEQAKATQLRIVIKIVCMRLFDRIEMKLFRIHLRANIEEYGTSNSA